VDCYVFVSSDATAFTTDPAGVNLPADQGPWCYVRKANDRQLRRPEAKEVIHGLRADGWAIVNVWDR
jgi:hypothetical protein